MRRLLCGLALFLVFGCAKAGTDAPWRATAAAAGLLAPGQVDAAEQALSALAPAAQGDARALLGKVAQARPGLEGVRAAYDALDSGLPAVSSGQPTKGTDPAQAAVLGAAQVWFQGFLVQSGQAVAAGPEPVERAAALLAAVDGMELWSSGVRTTLRAEARRGLGDALYVLVLQRSGPQ